MRGVKSVLTTGEVARICKVAPRTVSKWFDSGQLRGYRIPGSKDRRIPLEQLVRFMRSHHMPVDGVGTADTRMLVLDDETGIGEALRKALSERAGFEVVTAGSAIEAGAAIARQRPDVFLVEISLPDVDPGAFVRFLRTLPDDRPIQLIGMAIELSDARGQALLQQGFDGYLSKPFEVSALLHLIDAEVANPVG